ncbi:protein prenyltransferase alpha subunit repeat-containing protein 1 [Trichogramma pretiosum]|uniref:protein prenyltransferase alpha subunit repeat-containing protein 1 n=1 Tax=Trichogramma pretiosum TaxID=7493 RepID=UPI0006C941F1|nr:protein prenyltransferase alpha subunit repeat-containing protein 1 [Trichogramma pretiosum]XP_014225154.1 protein prenyltransferase alpha subunit repeat-containing protein 1 [Trichogramma pretiosum]
MLEESFPAAERILSDLENIFKKNQNLSSFEIIPAEDNGNKSPVHYDENAVGLESWCVKPLFCYVYHSLIESRKNILRRTDTLTLSRWLFGALLLNPDISTFWNMRREFVRCGKIDSLEELRFIGIVLYFKPKCFEAFSYRSWILNYVLQRKNDLSINLLLLFQKEMQTCDMAAERYKNNCHAWSYRSHVLTEIKKSYPEQFNLFLRKEWQDSRKWCCSHISDYSGLSYRQVLLKLLLLHNLEIDRISPQLSLAKDIIFKFIKIAKEYYDATNFSNLSHKDILDLLHGTESIEDPGIAYEQSIISVSYWIEDCLMNEQLICMFPGHEALWCHRRFLAIILNTMQESYAKNFFYENTSFDNFQVVKFISKDISSRSVPKKNENLSPSLLSIAFTLYNENLIEKSKHENNCQRKLALNFHKLLSYVNLQLNESLKL